MKSIGTKILEAARAKNPNKDHPRIVMTDADFARLRENKDRGLTANIVKKILEQADSFLELPPRVYEIPDGIRLLSTSRAMQSRIQYCAFAYQVTGEEKYAARAVKEIEAAAAFPDWHPYHYLDVATLAVAFAFSYDWLYGYLTEETKALMRRAMIEFGMKTAMDDYTDNPARKRSYRWYQDKPGDNWKMVCNGALTLSVLAIFDDEDCDLYEPVLTHAFEDTFEAVRTFYDGQDGTYSEGVVYWEYATEYLAYYSKGLFTATGSDFGLTDWKGVSLSPYFILSLSSPDRVGFNFGDAGESSITCPLFSWCADRYNDPALYSVRRPDIAAGRINCDDVMFFRDVEEKPLAALPLAFGREGGDNATFRTDISSSALYAAIHFAKNHAYHGHNDMGTFVVNIGNKRFFVDLGPDNYNLKPYRDAYRYRAEGHNTVIFNPSPENDQCHKADCSIARFAAEGDSFAIADMSEAYTGQKVTRGMKMLRESGSVLLQDEIECEAADAIRWSAHTPASVIFRDQGKTAVLDIDGTKMCAILLTEGYFTVRAACADENSPVPGPAEYVDKLCPQATNSGVQKLVVNLTGKQKHTVAVWFYPLTAGREIPVEHPQLRPLSEW
ncbi:MAG: heparinase II/III family protein [Clostridia bacterium]|nr:heparinase II/III family protein [Clostridia bacterium]